MHISITGEIPDDYIPMNLRFIRVNCEITRLNMEPQATITMNTHTKLFPILLVPLLLVATLSFAAIPFARATPSCDSAKSELSYANGQLVCMLAPHVNDHPSPGLLKNANDLYIAAYMPLPAGCDITNPSTCGPETLPGGFQPNCNPCFHGGPLNNFPYHDHVLDGAPGAGTQGTAGNFTAPWHVFVVVYDPAISNQPGFTPLKSAAAIDWGEAHGYFLVINPGASNPYEIDSGVVLICPVVHSHS